MGFYQFKREQEMPVDLDTAWQFISRPENLKAITPDYMGFDIITKDLPEVMYEGMIIEYRVRPLLGLSMRWVTEITHIEQGSYFVDEQRVGPYSMWHHEHFLKAVDGGVLMQDIVSYKPPFGLIGSVANAFVIKKQLQEIFDYRKSALIQQFGEWVKQGDS